MITQPFCFLMKPANLQHRPKHNTIYISVKCHRHGMMQFFKQQVILILDAAGLVAIMVQDRSLTSFVTTFRFNSIVCISG